MVTENEARELLRRAAATIEVPPGRFAGTAQPSHPRWLAPLVAAVAIAVAIAGGVALIHRSDGNASPGGPVPRHPLPSLVGWDVDAVSEYLGAWGVRVTTQEIIAACLTPGRVLATTPRAGTQVTKDSDVEVTVTSESPTADCKHPSGDGPAWQLLDFADQRGPAPAFTENVEVFLNGRQTTLTGQEAANRESWSGESALRVFLEKLVTDGNGQPWTATKGDGSAMCDGREVPGGLESRPSLHIAVRSDDPEAGCATLDIYRTGTDDVFAPGGTIDAIVVRTSDDTAPPDTGQVAPLDGRDIARRFLRFARGQADGIPADTPVRLYLNNEYRWDIAAAQAGDRDFYYICPSEACTDSAVRVLHDFTGTPTVNAGAEECFGGARDVLDAGDAGGSHFVTLSNYGPASCRDAWAIQLVYNDVSQIVAVNLLIARP